MESVYSAGLNKNVPSLLKQSLESDRTKQFCPCVVSLNSVFITSFVKWVYNGLNIFKLGYTYKGFIPMSYIYIINVI